jgi:hypothetical protein
MRWDHLRLDDEPTGQPRPSGDTGASGPGQPCGSPLFGRGTITRTFDTPGFRGMTFFEVQAKSIVNRIPESSRMPFRWTINPYRGCQHACFLLLCP